MPPWLRCARAVSAVQCSALLALQLIASCPARAATLEWSGAEACPLRDELADEVQRLIERPLAEVGALRFTVQVTGTPGRFRLQLETREAAGAPAVRTLTGSTCSELAQAAAIAIALAIRESEDIDGRGSSDSNSAEPTADPESDANAKATSRGEAPADARPPPAPVAPPADSSSPWGASLAVAALVDGGSLPGFGPGAELEASLQYGSVRLMGAGALLASREVRRSDGSGGEFQLGFAALMLCAERLVGPAIVLIGCAGGELGRLSAQGFGITDPEQGSSAWRALRFEVGAAWVTSDSLRLFSRAGAGVPLVRPQFVLGGTERLHQASTLASRLLVGVELNL